MSTTPETGVEGSTGRAWGGRLKGLDARLFSTTCRVNTVELLAQLGREGARPEYTLLAGVRPCIPHPILREALLMLQDLGKVCSCQIAYRSGAPMWVWALDTSPDILTVRCSIFEDALDLLMKTQSLGLPATKYGPYSSDDMRSVAALWCLLHDFPHQSDAALYALAGRTNRRTINLYLDLEVLKRLRAVKTDPHGCWVGICPIPWSMLDPLPFPGRW